MKKYLLLGIIFLLLFGCSKKPSHKSFKDQVSMSGREARKRIKKRHNVAMMDKRDCPKVKKNRKEKRLNKKESKKQKEEPEEK